MSFPRDNRSRRRYRYKKLKDQINGEAITNLSSVYIDEETRSILTRGLKFVPLTISPSFPLTDVVSQIKRSLETKLFFRGSSKPRPALYKRSLWDPPSSTHPEIIKFLSSISEFSISESITDSFRTNSNITASGQNKLSKLMHNKDIVIKSADKGGSIVILDRSTYINKAIDHLSDKDTYVQVDYDFTMQVKEEIESYIIFLAGMNYLHSTIRNFITPSDTPRTPLFYILPKIHKIGIPPRPIVSQCNGPTCFISEFLSYVLTPIAEAQPSYIKDTGHFLRNISSLPTLPVESFLVTADVASLYTNIPHQEGIDSILSKVNDYRHLAPPHTPPNHVIKTLLDLVLKRNYFKFMDRFYWQKRGTSMGSRVGPSYANLFMAVFEDKLIENWKDHIQTWMRFIDDIFFIFLGTLDDLLCFMDMANNSHPDIKLEFTHSSYTVNFLDVTIYKDSNLNLQSTLYHKPTDKHLLLHFSSNHIPHLFKNIVFSQALRYKRNISDPHNLNKELCKLKEIFRVRGYPIDLIQKEMDKVQLINRFSLLYKKKTLDKRAIPSDHVNYKLPYHSGNTSFKRYVQKQWLSLIHDPSLKELFPSPPLPIVTKGKCLKDLLVHTKFS